MTDSALGTQYRKDTLDLQFGNSGTLYLALHADDPTDSGGAGVTEFVGTNYARATIAEGDWAAATTFGGGYVIKVNANDIVFTEAVGNWAFSNNATWIAIWKHPTSTAEADFVGRFPVTVPAPVLDGQIATIAAGDLQIGLGPTP